MSQSVRDRGVALVR